MSSAMDIPTSSNMGHHEQPMRTHSPVDDVPLVVLKRIETFDRMLNTCEQKLLEQIDRNNNAKSTEQPSPIDSARTDLMWLYTANSLYAMSLSVRGEKLDKHPTLQHELARIKQNFARLKALEDRALMPKLNPRAAKSFVRNAMFDGDEYNAKRKQDEAMEDDVPPTKRRS